MANSLATPASFVFRLTSDRLAYPAFLIPPLMVNTGIRPAGFLSKWTGLNAIGSQAMDTSEVTDTLRSTFVQGP